MKIKIKVPVVGPGIFLARNQEYDLPKSRARELISVGYATPVAEAPSDKQERAIRTNRERR